MSITEEIEKRDLQKRKYARRFFANPIPSLLALLHDYFLSGRKSEAVLGSVPTTHLMVRFDMLRKHEKGAN